MSNIKHGLELVPRSCWASNLRHLLTDIEWHLIRTKVKREANFTCYCCRGQGKLHAHEVWSYDDGSLIQKLEDVRCLCDKCHLVKHYGYARVKRKDKEALAQLIKINGCTEEEATTHIANSFTVWARRSQLVWRLDINNLGNFIVKQ